MAAYAALTSLENIIHNLQNHPFPPISIDKRQVRSLTELFEFLQEFLRGYSSDFAYSQEADPLETRIADAAHKAEDVIESKIVDVIHSRQSTVPGNTTEVDLYQDLQLVLEEMELIKKAATTIRSETAAGRPPQLQRNVPLAIGSSSTSFSTRKKNSMVGFDGALNEVLESLMGSRRNLQIIPITGMGGIGKTTLARNIFENACVKEYFYIRAWTTIAQDYNAQRALKELLSQQKGCASGESEDELGLELYQYLSGMRYLVVMDDMWSIEVWEKIRHYFPDNKDGSRIIITTRQSNLVSHLNNDFSMKFLDELSGWNLFSKTVFGDESFPLEFEEIGKKIVRKCKGLPLSIVIVGGLLAKSEQTREYWEHIEGNLNSIVNLEDDEYCLRILKMSYNHLPVHLKPCFLYMGVFEEDCKIHVSTLIKLWVSEGFLQPTSKRTLETIGEGNLKNLIERNLVLVDELGSTGKIKYCRIHDLLRDICLREGEKERFYHVFGKYIPHQGLYNVRRIVVTHRNTSSEKFVEALESKLHCRSFLYDYFDVGHVLRNFRLLRILRAYNGWVYYFTSFSPDDIFQLVNLRYLALGNFEIFRVPSLLDLFWNLQTLIIDNYQREIAPVEIWNMAQLRHVYLLSGMYLPDPPTGNIIIMKNLQTLSKVISLKLNHDVVKKIPNIKKLGIESSDDHSLSNLEFLHKLESFRCSCLFRNFRYSQKMITFPHSLKKLHLHLHEDFQLEEILVTLGSLPLLKKLKLKGGLFETGEWQIVEGQFSKLEFLELTSCGALERWTSDSYHFPVLKKIYLYKFEALKEIPLEIGDIPTLKEIKLRRCSESIVMSAKRIVEEQQELQEGEQLQFHVRVLVDKDVDKEEVESLQRLVGPNFEVTLLLY